MFLIRNVRGTGLFLIATLTTFAATQSAIASNTSGRSRVQQPRVQQSAARSNQKSRAAANCNTCGSAKPAKKKLAKPAPCKPKGYIDPKVSGKFNAALRDLKRAGIKPQITSAWRSSERQAQLYRCSNSKRCRRAHPGLYYAKPAGSSLHEAGFAVDISGIARGRRGAKTVTPQGQRIISIMRKYGFKWRYGLADPAHFEADPTRHGYRNVKQAIVRNQTQCSVKLASRSSKPSQRSNRNKGNQTLARAEAQLKPYSQKRQPVRASGAVEGRRDTARR